MAATDRVITSAGLIMTVVFLGFVANPSPLARMLGVSLATAVALDATMVRMLVVPASMTLLVRANWWLPRSLDRWLPRVGTERAGGRSEPALSLGAQFLRRDLRRSGGQRPEASRTGAQPGPSGWVRS